MYIAFGRRTGPSVQHAVVQAQLPCSVAVMKESWLGLGRVRLMASKGKDDGKKRTCLMLSNAWCNQLETHVTRDASWCILRGVY